MKLKRSQIEYISNQLVKHLGKASVIKFDDHDAAAEAVRQAFTDDLRVEDRLNEEVRELLEEHADKMAAGSVQYHEMFKLVKAKLIRERKLIL
ncbi:MAG: DUF507 family protein [Acidobacteriota bacterium]